MSATPTVESLHAQWVAAFNAHDLARHIALYHEDAMLFGAVDELQDGRQAIRAYFGKAMWISPMATSSTPTA